MKTPYDHYKASGVEWIGDIPEHWQVSRLKFQLAQLISGGTPETSEDKFWADDEDGVAWVSIADITASNGSLTSTKKRITQAGLQSKGLQIVPKGTLLISMFASLGKVTETAIETTINQAILGLVPNERINKGYLRHYLSFIEPTLAADASQNTQLNLNANKIKNLVTLQISLPEQAAIAEYLDRQTAEIDATLARKEAMLKKLGDLRAARIHEVVTRGLNPDVPLKASGVEWIGDIPEHWEVRRLKDVCAIKGRIGFKGYTKEDLVDVGEGALTLGAKHIDKLHRLTLKEPEYISWAKYYESPEIIVRKGDIIFTQRGSLGKVALIKEDIGKATINPSMVLLNEHTMVSEFFFYFLINDFVRGKIEEIQTATAVPMVSQSQLGEFEVLVPPLAEQATLAEYLDAFTQKIDALCGQLKAQMEALRQYRQSLITEVVTGKLRVA